MSSHFIHRRSIPRERKYLFPPHVPPLVKSHIRHLDRPHLSTADIHMTPIELAILIASVALLTILLLFLFCLCLQYSMRYLKRKVDAHIETSKDDSKNNARGGDLFLGVNSERLGINFGRGIERLGERTALLERSGLLGLGEGHTFGDGARDRRWSWRENETSGRISVVHRDDCEGQCGSQTRRRSVE